MVVSYTNACFGRWIANKGQASTLKANSKLNSKQLYNSLKYAEKKRHHSMFWMHSKIALKIK